jgi:hypothetical protein
MTLTIPLSDDLERELSAEAGRLGLTLQDYALRLLEAQAPARALPRSGAELVAFWDATGVIGSAPAGVDAPGLAREIRVRAERRRRG